MADLADVEAALVAEIGRALFPGGPGTPSVLGVQTKVYRGWPNPQGLDDDLRAGTVNVSVFPKPGMSRTTTRYPRAWREACPPSASLTVSVAGGVATFGGFPGSRCVAGIRNLDRAYAVPVAPADTPETVAASLAALVPGASASGAAVVLADPGPDFTARVAGFGAAVLELRRQVQAFLVSTWCPTPGLRDRAAAAVDAALAAVDHLVLPDGTRGRLQYQGTHCDDAPSKAALWRRDLNYSVEYPTTLIQSQPSMLFGELSTSTGHVHLHSEII